ncbi:MAG TPA: hypothetical protein ENK84_02750 [Desulfobulbus sp.]|nr:hypothetical protein [Desulfobulbus sp.]
MEIELDEFLIKSASAKGKRLSNRVVRRVTNITGKPRKQKPVPATLPGITASDPKEGPAKEQENKKPSSDA